MPRLTGSQPCAESPGFTCSNLTVPLDHQGRVKGELGLQVAVQNGPAPRGVLVFLTGGPGQPGAPFASRIASRLGPVLAGYRLVMIDQRGTGPNALQCPALQAQMGSSDLAPPTKAAVTACARAIGPKRRFFGTDQTVQDLDLLRRALGVDKLNLDGVSYGTFVAERYALRYPTHVARLVLDSVVPHVGINGLSVENASAVGRVLRSLCSDLPCKGDPAEQLAFVVRTSSIDTRLLDALVTLSVFDPTYPGVIGALYAASHGRRGRPPAARRPLRARPEDAGRGAQPGPPRRRALCRQPHAVGRAGHAGTQPSHGAARRRRPRQAGVDLALHARGRVRQRDRPHVSLLAARAGSCRPARQAASGADAAARR